ncbi:MAG TPA: outer membrane lipoprotein chaperone LolA [Spongiibacteraceae bacterium]|nr:outer membrane lipoprotein chaperone LolA [Spongiibacteraceae bacterium]
MSTRLEGLKSLQAQFVQTVSDEKGKVLQTSQGTLAVKRGNHLRWETSAPFAYLIVTDGSMLWRYDRDLEQATQQKFKGELADTPALILSGDMARIRANYEVRFEQGGTGEYFHLAPKQKNALFHSLTLLFSGNSVSQLVLQDNLDQRTEIRFNSVVNNPVLADSLFHFDPPKGVDVVDDES